MELANAPASWPLAPAALALGMALWYTLTMLLLLLRPGWWGRVGLRPCFWPLHTLHAHQMGRSRVAIASGVHCPPPCVPAPRPHPARPPASDADATALLKLQPPLAAAVTSATAAASSCLSSGSPQLLALTRDTDTLDASRMYCVQGLAGGGLAKMGDEARRRKRRDQQAWPLATASARNLAPSGLLRVLRLRYASGVGEAGGLGSAALL